MKKSEYLPSPHKNMLVESEVIRKILDARRKFKTVFL